MTAITLVAARTQSRSRRIKLGTLLSLVVLIAAAVLVVAPIAWALATSLRTPATSFDQPPQWIPSDPVWSNYKAVFQQVPLAGFFVNSFLVTGLIVVGQLITSTMSGYAFAMVRFRGSKALFWIILATMMVPLQTTIIPVFLIIKYLGLTDSRLSLILPAVGGAFGTFLMRQYFLQMPRELGEAGRVDGASHFQVFARIYAPMARAPMATLAVLTFSAYWNEFFRPLIFLQSTSKFTLPLGLVTLQGTLGTGSISIVLAGVIIALIPSVLIFLAAQRYFVEGIVAGSFR
ncbi:multiple sugar transport system permease protein [Kribbella antiqua]|uniref:Multiple sugar transport system permease protein n=1 Tax=Kribbella antiqua TaxID=2512217 RepID=A0A4R2J4P0_9ACTN|nr:carbohydrate ABC transporter permease [Kribbella antiqua]TCO51279.1 multiple sugar transport system permease protein [Kribbella antiqua]